MLKIIIRIVVVNWLLLAPALAGFLDKAEVREFINMMHKKHHYDKKELNNLFKSINVDNKVIQAISRPFEERPWHVYKERFVTIERAKLGVKFYKENKAALQEAYSKYGVKPSIIVAILGVETYYGRMTGTFPVLQSLATLAFNYPPRADFFKSELEHFLLLAKEEHLNPKNIMGSYAGAMGIPQFVSSSYRKYAVDFENRGRRNLISNPKDAIGSVANYFKMHGWEKDQPIAMHAYCKGNIATNLYAKKHPKPNLSLQEFKKYNITVKEKGCDLQTKAALLSFTNHQQTEDWLTFNNFYVITRYNHSNNYAMAVMSLSELIEKML